MIQLFHEGTSHVYDGITCEMMMVNEFGFEHHLDNGWVFDVKELYPETKPEVEESSLEETVEKAIKEVDKVQVKKAEKKSFKPLKVLKASR